MLFDPEETYLWGLKSRTSVFILSVVSVATFVVDLAFQVSFVSDISVHFGKSIANSICGEEDNTFK